MPEITSIVASIVGRLIRVALTSFHCSALSAFGALALNRYLNFSGRATWIVHFLSEYSFHSGVHFLYQVSERDWNTACIDSRCKETCGRNVMWIVRLALRRPYTFVVVSILIVIMGVLSIVRTPTDIFPNIDIPVVSIIWNYNGLVPEDMSDRIVSVTERALTTTVDNIEHIESQSLYGIAVVKVFLQPNANIQQGIAQITAVSQTQLRQLPAGTTPPLIIAYSASSVPVLQLALSGQDLSEQQLNDYGLNFIRTQLITVPGASVPYPYGGKQRQVQVDLNTTALQSKGLSALDVVNAISATESDPAHRNVEDRLARNTTFRFPTQHRKRLRT